MWKARVLMLLVYVSLAVPLRLAAKAYFNHDATRAEWIACQVCFVLGLAGIGQMGRALYKAGRASRPGS